jgi:hypothetical protein
MSPSKTPSGVTISRVIRAAGDPLAVDISTSWSGRDGSHDHYREGTSLRAIEDKNGACFRDLPLHDEWTTICDGVEIRHRSPVPNDRNYSAWDLCVRRDAAPIYAHIRHLEEYYSDDSSFGDGTSRSESFVYAVRIEAAEKDTQEEGHA